MTEMYGLVPLDRSQVSGGAISEAMGEAVKRLEVAASRAGVTVGEPWFDFATCFPTGSVAAAGSDRTGHMHPSAILNQMTTLGHNELLVRARAEVVSGE